MKKIFFITLTTLALTSCVTQKQRSKICLTCTVVTQSHDSIIEKIVRDTITLPPIAGPIQYLENPCKELCDSLGNLKPFIKTERKNGVVSTIRSVGNSIVVKCDTDSLQAEILKIEKERFQKIETVQRIPCHLQHESKFSGFTFWWFWITAGLLFLWLIWKFCKTWLKAYIPFLK
ncbi:MAG: hypothetical protein M3R27_05885 [Bacteroidota bacterium]|nr:hypothetical protein [Bacteroidota bacterium]